MDYGYNCSYKNKSSGEMRLIILKSTHYPTNKKPPIRLWASRNFSYFKLPGRRMGVGLSYKL